MLGILTSLISVKLTEEAKILDDLAECEKKVRTNEDQSNKILTVNICKVVITQALPSEMKNQMQLKQRFDTFTEFKVQLRDDAVSRKVWNTEAAPMSVDAVWGKGKDGKGKGYGKDYEKVTCNKRGKTGKLERNCWNNGTGYGKDKCYGKDKGYNKDKGYGKDKSYGKDKGHGKEVKGTGDKGKLTCHRSGHTGHFARDCSAKAAQ
jgi:hypothetical protein